MVILTTWSRMSWKDRLALTYKDPAIISWFDFTALALLCIGGALYLHNALHWGVAWIGEAQYGDAEFWWNGALHVAQGLFKDNPGNGYRPGYFFLTGLTLPVLGQKFLQFYPYFLLTFLSVSGFFYLALRQLLGRWVAACVLGTLIFNPFTAEWVATSTTDATGLLLNLLSLTCLLFGVVKKLNRNWLIAFGFLFSLATLTRPLITPFVGVVLLFLFCAPKEPFKKRLHITVCVFIAFCVPTILWMGIQKLTIDQWSVSSNDASAFYAASDPAIQVWTPAMYDTVQKIAANRYHVALKDVNDKMLNQVFWQETIKNYVKYPRYHLQRALPHLLRIALFSPANASHGTPRWRVFLFETMILSLITWLVMRREFFFASLFIVIGISLCIFPTLITLLVLAGSILGLIKKDKESQPGMFLLSAYWFTGVVALYLVGGTWVAPSASLGVALNALGYRLGAQFFFVGDILAAYALICLARLKLSSPIPSENYHWQTFFNQPAPLAGRLVAGTFGLFFTATIITYLVGGSIVAYRIYSHNHFTSIEPYPSVSPIIDAYRVHTEKKLIHGAEIRGGLDPLVLSNATVKTGNSDVIFTGTVSPFIWNLAGQNRAQIMVYAQNKRSPLSMGPNRVFVEVPNNLYSDKWIGKQGAFIIRDIPDKHNQSNLPYYLTVPALQAFIPLASDNQSFELSKATWFPLVKNATQLETSGELKTLETDVTWAMDSGEAHFQRRFFMAPHQTGSITNSVELILNIPTKYRQATLNFSYAISKITAQTQQRSYDIKISAIAKASRESIQTLMEAQNPIPRIGQADTIKNVVISIPSNTKAIKITFNNLAKNTGIWIYEFNLSVIELKHPVIKTASF